MITERRLRIMGFTKRTDETETKLATYYYLHDKTKYHVFSKEGWSAHLENPIKGEPKGLWFHAVTNDEELQSIFKIMEKYL